MQDTPQTITMLPPSEEGTHLLADAEKTLQATGWTDNQAEAVKQHSKRNPAAGQFSPFDLMPVINRTLQNLESNKKHRA